MYSKFLLAFCLLWPGQQTVAASNQNLPNLGDYTSGIISLSQERILGQQFLRSLRAGAPLVFDPILQEYVELLIYRLASNSQLEDRRFDLVIIDKKSLNAFAAPGGIVGINLGLFLYGETESEISAILSHEIAHLSQRHFARRSEAGKKASITSIAGILAGVILLATASGEAGMAALTASQALTQAQMLRYSRSRETEADRIGIDTLKESGLDPRAMAYMFERLNRASRFSGSNIPEFLLTHPVTKNRIADSYAKTDNLPNKQYAYNLDFQMMRARVQVTTAESNTEVISRMREAMKTDDQVARTAAQYGLALAQTDAGQFDNSMQNIMRLREKYPQKIAFMLAEADLHVRAERYDSAQAVLEAALVTSPNNYPLTMAYAEVLMNDKKPLQAVVLLTSMSQSRPNDQDVWYLLAEAHGLAQDIIGVHQARAEYFVLVGNFDQAIKQLGFATPLARNDFQQNAKIQQRIEEITGMMDRS